MVQHHNLDKALLVAGHSENRFGGGKVFKPMRFIFGDRATFSANAHRFSVEELVTRTTDSWFKNNLRFVKKNI